MTAQAQPTRRGALIVVEGLDRAGKSSQCEKLRERLTQEGNQVKYIRFPGNEFPYSIDIVGLTNPKTGQRPSGS